MAVVTQQELDRVMAERDAARLVALECIRVMTQHQWSTVRQALDELDSQGAQAAAV